MNPPPPTQPAAPASASDFLAAERTFLAWLRTSLALMGFGFVVARFGLFLRELEMTAAREAQVASPGLSLWFGIGLIVLGVAVALVSVSRHLRLVRDLNHGGVGFRKPSRAAIAIALLLAGGGMGLAFYVVFVHRAG